MLYHTTDSGPSVDAFRRALGKGIRLAIQSGSNEVAIAVHGKTNLNGVISVAIGEPAVALLQKPNGFLNFEEVRIFLITEKIRSAFRSGVLVAAHTSTKYLNKLLDDPRATDLIYIPWAPEELQEYLVAHRSTAI